MPSVGSPRILVVIPAFNEAENLRHVVEAVRLHGPAWDIVVVDDGSADDTAEVAGQLGAIVLRLPINLGIGGAVQTGLVYAARHGYDICLQVDGDGQHDAAESRRLVEELCASGADAVSGSRFLAAGGFQSTAARRTGIAVLRFVIGLLARRRISDPTSGQRAFGRRAIALLARHYPDQYPEPEVICILQRHGLRLVEIPVKMKARRGGCSSIRPFHSWLYMFKVIVGIFIHYLRSPQKEHST